MSNTYNIQTQIRQNASDIRSYINDLYSWEEEVNTKSGGKSQPAKKKEYAIRGNVGEVSDKDQKTTPKELQRDVNTIPSYYKAWDQFNVDKELEKLEEETPVEKKETPAVNPLQRTSGAKENTKIVIKGGRSVDSQIDSLKERGNLFFKTSDYSKALDCYSECISKAHEIKTVTEENMAILYSNRAMAYIKLGEFLKAKEDCDKAISYDDTHIKSYVRRGRALHKLNKLKEALSDLRLANDIEKGNKEVEEEINQINKKIQNAKRDGKNKMMLNLSVTNKEKYTIKVFDDVSQPAKAESKKETKSEIKFENENPGKTSNENNNSADYLKLKKIDGHVVHHNVTRDVIEEDSKQKVHFNINKNEEFTETTIPKNTKYSQNAVPKKSALKHHQNEEQAKQAPVEKLVQANKTNLVELGKKVLEQTLASTAEGETPVGDSTEFNNVWRHIKQNTELCEKFLSTRALPENFTKIFKQGVEFDLFFEILDLVDNILPKNADLSCRLLHSFTETKRFDILLKGLTSSEKKKILSIFQKLEEEKKNLDASKVDGLKKKYSVL